MPYLLKTMLMIDALLIVALVIFHSALASRHRSVVSGKVIALALITPAVALFCGNIFIFCGYLATVVAFNARSRSELAATYVFLLPLMPNVATETGVGSIYLLSVSAVQAMGLGALVAFLVGNGRRSLALTRYDVSAMLLVVIFVVASNHNPSVSTLLRGLAVNVFAFAGPYLLISRGLSSRDDVDRLLLRLTLGACVAGVTAFFQATKHWLLFELYYRTLHVPVSVTSWTLAMRGGLLRSGGSLLDYSCAGLFLAAAVTLTTILRSRYRPAGFWMVIAVLVAGLLATQSRGAWLAAILGQVFIMVYRGKWTRALLLVGAGVAAEVLILLFATSGRLAAIVGRTSEASSTLSYRRQLLSRGIEQVRAHPLIGQSQDQVTANLPDLVQGQQIVDFVNAHLYVAMTAGVPLFLVWCYVWLAPVLDTWRLRTRFDESGGLLAAPAAIIIPVMVALGGTSIMDRNLTWPTIALGLAGPCLALGRRRAGPASAHRPRTPLVTVRPALVSSPT